MTIVDPSSFRESSEQSSIRTLSKDDQIQVLKILLVEDNPMFASLIRASLEDEEKSIDTSNYNFEVKVVDRLDEARKAISAEEYDLLLLDLTLPDSEPKNSLEFISEACSRTAVIVLTGVDETHYADKALIKGAQDYIRKDEVTPKGLLRAIRFSLSRDKAFERRAKTDIQRERNSGLRSVAASIAHDFNNLFMTVMGNASLASLAGSSDDSVAKALEEIQRAVRDGAVRIRDILTSSGHFQLENLSPTSLSSLAEDLLALARSKTNSAVQIEFIKDPIGNLGVQVDRSAFREASEHILRNAIEAIERDRGKLQIGVGTIKINPSDLPPYASDDNLTAGLYGYVEVADSGVGIPKDFLPRLFDPFFSTKGTGRGLGLSTALGILHAHRGTVIAESSVGTGSKFRLCLPIEN